MTRRAAGTLRSAAVSVLILAGACAPQPASKPEAAGGIGWRRLGAWSGRGNMQTESFNSQTGSLRIRWTARAADGQSAGFLRIILHSAISGRPLGIAVDRQGPGQNVAYLHEDPRDFYAEVESSGLEWSFTVEEGVRVP